jgi:hypothetical protein
LREKSLTSIGRSYAPRRAVQQPNAKPVLKGPYRLA